MCPRGYLTSSTFGYFLCHRYRWYIYIYIYFRLHIQRSNKFITSCLIRPNDGRSIFPNSLIKCTFSWCDKIIVYILYICIMYIYIYMYIYIATGHLQKVYLGTAEGNFKRRYYNHKKSFRNRKYANETSLSNISGKWKINTISAQIYIYCYKEEK